MLSRPMLTIADAVVTARPCACRCHETLTTMDRTRGIAALYECDDALRGWGYAPIYELHGDALWRAAQAKADPTYRGVAVRFGECIHRRLLGSMLHEILHASFGDPARANHGIPFGLPYGVPGDLAPSAEEAFLAPFNFAEARAFVGVWVLGRAMFGIDWDLRTARDVGTYGFAGGNALVTVPAGFRAVAHVDRQHHAERYYARARRLEEEARAWFTEANVESLIDGVRQAAARGRATRPKRYPDPAEVARLAPRKIGRNEPCTCGSAEKFKACCGVSGGTGSLSARAPSMAR
jgi:hypothetical protein